MRLENLQTAEYKGVQFGCNLTRQGIGRAKVIHRFANSDADNIEDQGKIPRSYNLTAIITGVDYRAKRDALLNAIDGDASPGVLIHPFYGRIENVVAMPTAYDENVTDLGRVVIPLIFRISDSDGIPAVTQVSTSGITNRRDTTIAAVTEDFTETYSVNNSFTGNYEASQTKANDLVAAIRRFVTSTSISSTQSAQYFSNLDTFERNINGLVNNPEGMGESITRLIGDISGLYDTSAQTLAVANQFATFGDGDTPINPTTGGLAQRRRNNIAFNEAVRVSALSVSYQATSQIGFRTIDDIESAQRGLEGKYESLRF